MTRALLVYPEFRSASFWNYRETCELVDARYPAAPLGLCTVAALLPADWEVSLVDRNIEAWDDAMLDRADIVLTGGMMAQQLDCVDLIRKARQRGKRVVVGGPDATSSPHLYADADHLVLGEGEITIPQFLADLAAGSPKKTYQDAGRKADVQSSPTPRFDLLKFDRYNHIGIQWCRGCPFSCEFCDIIELFGKVPRAKSAPQIFAELQKLYDLGYRGHVDLVDDNFIGNKKEAKEVLHALAAWQEANDYPVEMMTETTLNLAQDDELLRLMHRANFTTIFIGIESPRAASLQETHKTQNLRESILDSVHRIQRAGIEVMAGMIVGFDNDDPSIFEEQFRFIQEARIPISMTGMLNALPKTPLYDRLRNAGRLLAESVGDQFVFTNIIPQGMSTAELYEGYQTLLRKLYGYANYRRRTMQLILAKGTAIRSRLSTGGQDLRIFGRVLWSCVLKASPKRAWMTLSLVLETALRRPRAIRQAVTLALMHKHLYEYMRDTCARLEEFTSQMPAPSQSLEAHTA